MTNKKRVFTAEQKVKILREYLDNQVSVSELCNRYNIQPSSFYNWKKKLFEGAVETFKVSPTIGINVRPINFSSSFATAMALFLL